MTEIKGMYNGIPIRRDKVSTTILLLLMNLQSGENFLEL